MAQPKPLSSPTIPAGDQTPIISLNSPPFIPRPNHADPFLPSSSGNMNPPSIRLSVPTQIHLPGVYASSSAAKSGGSFEITNEGEETVKVDLEKRGVEVEFWASPPSIEKGEIKHGELTFSSSWCIMS
jgi:hypothetical protein